MEKENSEGSPSGNAATLPMGITEQELAELTPEERSVLLNEEPKKEADPKGDVDPKGKEAASSKEKETQSKSQSDLNQPDQKHKVKVAGQEMEVTLGDLIAGYQKGTDYTQKSQRVAKILKTIENDPLGFIEQNPVIGNKLLEQYRQRSAVVSEPPAFDVNDPEGSARRIQEWAVRKAQAEVMASTQKNTEQAETIAEVKMSIAQINEARKKDGAEPLTPEEIQSIAEYGDENGIPSFAAAYKLKNFDAEIERARTSGARSVIEQVKKGKGEEGKRLPAGGAGGAAPAALNLDSLTSDQIDSLSDKDLEDLLVRYGGAI